MTAMLRSRRFYRPMGLLFAVLVLLVINQPSFGRVSAQQSPDCEDPETVACIPLSGTDQPGDQPSGVSDGAIRGAAAPAAAAAPPSIVRPPCLPPYPPQPIPLPYPRPYAAPAAAPGPPEPGPLPYPCYDSIFSTINRANLAYARAMRSLSASLLHPYWGRDALKDLLGQIATLRATNSYRVLRLASIDVLEQNVYPGNAWVHTSEHWITSTWSRNGYSYNADDAWYDNQYYLYQAGGRWVIGTDIVN